jgi:chemotaxis protein MotA
VIARSLIRDIYSPQKMAVMLVDLSIIAKKKGLLALSNYDEELARNTFLHRSMQMAIDGQKPADIDFILSREIGALAERHKRSASITRRASETAPAMGLIGTLVGLVQMLANLESPDTIGPAMAVALLTTFYGAILGTVIMAPLSGKLEKNSQDEALIKNLIRLTAIGIARQDNPRKLEMDLNASLPPSQKIKYFD